MGVKGMASKKKYNKQFKKLKKEVKKLRKRVKERTDPDHIRHIACGPSDYTEEST